MAWKTSSAPLQSHRDGESSRPRSCTDSHWPFASHRQRARKRKFRRMPHKAATHDIHHDQDGGRDLHNQDWPPHCLSRSWSRGPAAAARHVKAPCPAGHVELPRSVRSKPSSFSRLRVVVDRKGASPPHEERRRGRAMSGNQTTGVNHMRLVIIGAGFAGMYAALSAARLRDIQGVSPEELEIALVAPEPTLVVRPRLYEPKPETLTAPLLDVLKAIDVVYVQGSAETVDTKSRMVQITTAKGTRKTLSYDRLVVATGSRLFRPNIPGLAEHGFSVDSLDDAVALDKHLRARQSACRERARHGRRGRRRLHRHRGGNGNARAASRDPRQGCQDARHHRRPQQRDRARHGRRSPPRHRGRPAQARRGDPARRRRRLARRIRRHACPAANTSKPRP